MESGLLNFGGDTDASTTPFDVRLGRFVDHSRADSAIGIAALRQVARDGPKRQQLGIILDGVVPAPLGLRWEDVWRNNTKVGSMTSCVWSPRLQSNIGYVLASTDVRPGDAVEVRRASGATAGRLTELPFL